jgi:programmed cell death 8 (apoptosis-inducing factor)
VYQLFPEAGNLGLVLPPALAAWTLNKVKKEGVEVFANITPTAVEADKDGVKLTTSNGIELSVDHVVVAVGLQPNTQLAESARLETDPLLGGFRVNSELQACTNVWAVSSFTVHTSLVCPQGTCIQCIGILCTCTQCTMNSMCTCIYPTKLCQAGDVSCFYDPHLGRRRVEHHDHAQVSSLVT